jgi:hypothetical protein
MTPRGTRNQAVIFFEEDITMFSAIEKWTEIDKLTLTACTPTRKRLSLFMLSLQDALHISIQICHYVL